MGVVLNAKSVDWRAFHETIDAEVPIVEVLAMLGTDVSQVNGRASHVLCPVHGETKPSLFVHPIGDRAHANLAFCFGACRQFYGPIALWSAVKGLSYIDAADELAGLYGIRPDGPAIRRRPRVARPDTPSKLEWPGVMAPDQALFYHSLLTPEDYAHLEGVWGLDELAVNQFKIGHTLRNDWPPAFTVPVWRAVVGQELYSIRFRRDDAMLNSFPGVSQKQQEWLARSTYWGLADRNMLLPFGVWSLDFTGDEDSGDWVIVCESEKTVLALTQYGLRAITLTGGVGGHPRGWLSWSEQYLDRFKFWLTMFDNDKAGLVALEGMHRQFNSRVIPVTWLEEWAGLDTVEVLTRFGFAAVYGRILQAVRCARHVGEDLDLSKVTYWLGFGGESKKHGDWVG